MDDRLVPIYYALTAADASALADRLDDAGIEAFAEVTDSPVEGLVLGPSARIVYVRQRERPDAEAIVRQFEADGFVGIPRDEWPREETGLELPTTQRPSTESPSQDIEGQQQERLDMNPPGPEAPEVADLIQGPEGHGRELDNPQDIKGFGPDRPLAQEADVERDEVENQRIDELDLTREFGESETGTPAPDLRPNNPDPGANPGAGPKGRKRPRA